MAERMSFKRLPARPTKGRPCLSSLAPGPSPITMSRASAGPSPGTALVRSLHKPHASHRRMSCPTASRSHWASGSDAKRSTSGFGISMPGPGISGAPSRHFSDGWPVGLDACEASDWARSAAGRAGGSSDTARPLRGLGSSTGWSRVKECSPISVRCSRYRTNSWPGSVKAVARRRQAPFRLPLAWRAVGRAPQSFAK